MTLATTRRGFIVGVSALAGGAVLGFGEGEAQTRSQAELAAWVIIEPDDTVIIRVARSDMGQGIFTALPMLVAEELECDWARVRAEYASPGENRARARAWGDMVTSNSISVRGSHDYLRRAGAQARQMLLAEAASRWGVAVAECGARDSVVTHLRSGRQLRFGELAEAASRRPVPHDVTLKRPEAWRLLGTPARRLEAPDKVFGRPIFASDVRQPSMLHAAVKACPSHGGRLKAFDAGPAAAMAGVCQVMAVGDDAVAVVATSWWQAKQALDALKIEWDETPGAALSTETLRQRFREGLAAPTAAIGHRRGDVDAAFAGSARRIEAEYEVPFLAHVTMEPQTCTAYVTEAHAEVWAPTQNAEGTLNVVAQTLGLDPARVVVNKCHLGGGFGRRGLSQDWARMAVLIAKAAGVPVKMTWSREEDIRRDHYRPMVLARQSAGFDASGRLTAWRVRLSGSSIAVQLSPRWLRDGIDMAMMDGFVEADMPYAVPSFEVGLSMRNTAIPVGFWRGVNLSQNGFFREAFVDEMAAAVGSDPYQFRRSLLLSNPRALAVLDEAAKRAGWGRQAAGYYQGMAIVEGDNSWCAQVVTLSGDAGAIRLHRIVCVVDPNYVVHPGITVAQMESGIVQGLSAALTGRITVEGGRVEQSNFHDYPFLRMNEMPPVEVHLLPSRGTYNERWGGIGETSLPPLAPALVNAVFAATGRRIRSLPLTQHGIGLG